MQVIFLQEVKGVAKLGEQKEVSEGYYRNFLQPKRIAVLPNDPAAVKVKSALAAKAASASAEIDKLKALAARLQGKQLSLTAKAQGKGDGQKLFGAIHEAQIAAELGMDKKLIKMMPIKTVGRHEVKLAFGHGINSTIEVTVQAE